MGTVVYRLAVEQLVNGGGVDSRYSRSVATDVLVAPCDSRGADWPGEDDRRVSLLRLHASGSSHGENVGWMNAAARPVFAGEQSLSCMAMVSLLA